MPDHSTRQRERLAHEEGQLSDGELLGHPDREQDRAEGGGRPEATDHQPVERSAASAANTTIVAVTPTVAATGGRSML